MARMGRQIKSRYGIPARVVSLRLPAGHMAFVREMMEKLGVKTFTDYVLWLIEQEAKRRRHGLWQNM